MINRLRSVKISTTRVTNDEVIFKGAAGLAAACELNISNI